MASWEWMHLIARTFSLGNGRLCHSTSCGGSKDVLGECCPVGRVSVIEVYG